MPSAIIYYIERMHWRSLWGKKNAAVQAAVRIRIRIPSGCAPCVRRKSSTCAPAVPWAVSATWKSTAVPAVSLPWSSPVPVGCAGFSDGILNFSFHGGVSYRSVLILSWSMWKRKSAKKDVDEPCPFRFVHIFFTSADNFSCF